MGSNGLKELCASHRENELERLVNLVADHYNFTQAETIMKLERKMTDSTLGHTHTVAVVKISLRRTERLMPSVATLQITLSANR
jgi:hypothetical protein